MGMTGSVPLVPFKALLSIIHIWKDVVLIMVHVCTPLCLCAYKLTKICFAAYKSENKLKSMDFRQLRI